MHICIYIYHAGVVLFMICMCGSSLLFLGLLFGGEPQCIKLLVIYFMWKQQWYLRGPAC